MSLDTQTFLSKYPEFSGVDPEAIQDQLDFATLSLSQGRLGAWYERLAYLWSAHYLYLRFDISALISDVGILEQENQGVTNSQSANTNGLSVTTTPTALVSGNNPLHADLARTNYGLQYLSILRQILSPIV